MLMLHKYFVYQTFAMPFHLVSYDAALCLPPAFLAPSNKDLCRIFLAPMHSRHSSMLNSTNHTSKLCNSAATSLDLTCRMRLRPSQLLSLGLEAAYQPLNPVFFFPFATPIRHSNPSQLAPPSASPQWATSPHPLYFASLSPTKARSKALSLSQSALQAM